MELPNSLAQTAVAFPGWLVRLARRIWHLPPGRYQITLAVQEQPDWSVLFLGDVESSTGDKQVDQAS